MTQFEALTAAAYSELAAREVEVAVIEAGLGGRYDATNVIRPKVQVLTSVGLEHTRWLGPTLADIAGEKLAVVQAGATLVLGADRSRPWTVAGRACAAGTRRADRATRASIRVRGGVGRPISGATSRSRAPRLRRSSAGSTIGCGRGGADIRVPGRLQVVGP